LVEGANVQPERMRMSLLVDGTISIFAPGNKGLETNYTYNYDPTGDWTANNTGTLMGNEQWSDTENSNPVADLIKFRRDARNRGIELTRVILSEKTWGYILANEKIAKDFKAANGIDRIITDSMLNVYLVEKTGLTFAIYLKQYLDEALIAQQFYPDDYITLLPATSVGRTYYGTTPEEADLISGQTTAKVALVNTGVAVTSNVVAGPPISVEIWASEIVLPSFEGMDSVFTWKVAGN
jgi:hypothetical protein